MVDKIVFKGVKTKDMQYIHKKLLSTEISTDGSVKAVFPFTGDSTTQV